MSSILIDSNSLAPDSQYSLTSRAARPAGPRGKMRGLNKRRGGQLTAQDLISLFQSMPVPNRGYRNPNADQHEKMGQGMKWFDQNNSPDQVATRLDRQNQEDWKRINRGYNAGTAAVDFVKQTKGYTDDKGNFVPPTMPATPSSKYGTGSVTFTDKPTRGTMTDPVTGKKVFMDEYLPEQSKVQDSKYGAMDGQGGGGALAKPRSTDLTALFPGSTQPSQPRPVVNNTPAVTTQPSANSDFWAWEQANRAPNTVGDVNPGEVPVVPAAPRDQVFIDPTTNAPTVGTISEKELARRANRGLFPGIVDQIMRPTSRANQRLGGFANSIWETLFGKDVNYQMPISAYGDLAALFPGQIPRADAQHYLPPGSISPQPDSLVPGISSLPSMMNPKGQFFPSYNFPAKRKEYVTRGF